MDRETIIFNMLKAINFHTVIAYTPDVLVF